MTVQDLIRELQALPGYWPVHVETIEDGSGGGCETAYRYILGVERANFPTQGNMAVIVLKRPEELT